MNRYFRATFVLVWFSLWSLHVGTGFLDRMIAHGGGKNAGIVGMLNNVTDALLVGPLGRGASVIALLLAGVGLAALTYKFSSRKAEA